MSQIEFDYNGKKGIIQCNKNDKIKDILEKFLIKSEIKGDNIYILYDGKILNKELTFNEAANDNDKKRNQMNCIVRDNTDEIEEGSGLKKSKYIICPECMENIRISLKDYKVKLYECRNWHETEDMQLDEFEKTQYIDESKIKCDNCKENNKNESYKNKFFICCTCNINLCPLCKNSHDKKHYIIDYEERYFICKIHCDTYSFYCNDCKKDICDLCEKQHIEHEKITYGSIIPDINKIKMDKNNLNKLLNKLKNDIKGIISKLNVLMDNLDIYYNTYDDAVTNFDIKKRNYQLLQNLNEFKTFNNDLMMNITEIINDKDIITKFNKIIKFTDNILFNEKLKKEDIYSENEEEEEEKDENKNGENEEEEKYNEIDDNKINESIKKYNQSDDKYDSFNINNLEEFKSFTTQYDNEKLMVLLDRRLLSYQKYCNENGDPLYKLCIYSLNDGIRCDINYNIEKVEDIFQMSDSNLLIHFKERIKIFKIKSKSIKEIDNFYEPLYEIYKLLNDKILLYQGDMDAAIDDKNGTEIRICLYKESHLDNILEFKIKYDVNALCQINENEIAFYCTKYGKLFGYNAFVIFYDLKYNKEIKSLKLGNWKDDEDNWDSGNTKIFLANENCIIVKLNDKLELIDTKSKTVKKTIKFVYSFKYVICLNNYYFLFTNDFAELKQFEIETFKLKSEKKIENNFFEKYPGNKLIIANKKKVTIYSYY